ncbi:MAG: hypothetical protein LBO76_06475, partial [Treponema sp.]|nr:hypothetical protein [Treponema sp.]
MAGELVGQKPHIPPPAPYYLERPRLNKILARAMQNPVVTVVAGQGYGKSSSVYSFLQNSDIVALWIQLTIRDNISRHFWENLCS